MVALVTTHAAKKAKASDCNADDDSDDQDTKEGVNHRLNSYVDFMLDLDSVVDLVGNLGFILKRLRDFLLWFDLDLFVLLSLSIFIFSEELLNLIESSLLSGHSLHHGFEIVVLHAVLLLEIVAALLLEFLILGHLSHKLVQLV